MKTSINELRLPGYQITRQIGQGGMGDVYEAIEEKLERKVAVKLIKAELISQPKILERFENEARVIAQINHPNIVTLHHYEKQEDLTYLVMEFIEGDNLQDLLAQKAVTMSQAVELFLQLLRGLSAAHDKNVVHRDIKPANIMLAKNGFIKILDFGLAKSYELPSTYFTTVGTVLGTTFYLSPEVASGKTPTMLSDLYSAGIVFYEMLTGHLPFQADTPLGTIEKIKTEPLPLPKKLNPELPDYLEKVLLKLCHKEPALRYGSALEVIQDLEAKEVADFKESRKPKNETLDQAQSSVHLRQYGYDPEEIEGILHLAEEIQKEKSLHMGRESVIHLGEELNYERDTLEKAMDQFKESKQKNRKTTFKEHGSMNFKGKFDKQNFEEFLEINLENILNKDQSNIQHMPKVSMVTRLMAFLIDAFIMCLTGIFSFGLASVIYFPLCYYLFDSQSLGQRVFGLKTLQVNGKKMNLVSSVIDPLGISFFPLDIILGLLFAPGPHFQRFTQFLAGTTVVNEDSH